MKFLRQAAACLLAAAIFLCEPTQLISQATAQTGTEQQNITIMIDPGHGGRNLGGQVPGIEEKNITFMTAVAMKEELEKYEGITVLMTRYEDTELSLQQRAQLAAEAGADFFFSLHYNKSVSGRLYGAEVWIPSLGENYSKAYACGDLILNELCDGYGLYRRGIKTKLGNGGLDYYGVIRGATSFGIPSMIIEHCHMENVEDIPFYNSPEKIKKLGVLDATGVAKYFGLRSEKLGVDYSSVARTQVAAPVLPVGQDLTPPETAQIVSAAKTGNTIKARLRGMDAQSPILYYDYSLDGGVNWSALQRWNSPGADYDITIPADASSLTVRIYNQYDLATMSQTVALK